MLVAENDAGTSVGFVELSIRTYISQPRRPAHGLCGRAVCDARIPISRDCALVAGSGPQLGAREARAGFASDRAERLIIDRKFSNSLSEK